MYDRQSVHEALRGVLQRSIGETSSVASAVRYRFNERYLQCAKSSKNRRGVEIVRRRAPAKKTIAGALSFVFANIAGRITSASGPGERDRSSQLLSIPSSIRQERGLWSVSEKLVNCCYTRGFSSTAVFERSAESPSDRQAIGAGAAANPLGEDGIRFHLNLWSLVRLAHHWRWLRCTAAVVTQVYIHQYTRLAAGTSARGS